MLTLRQNRNGLQVQALNLLPGIQMIRTYRMSWLPSDLAAGLTLGAVIVPVGLAFGQLAGLSMAGLYTSIFPLVAYALLGSSRQLVLSPDASMSTLVALSVDPLAGGDMARFAGLTGTMAVLVGCICILGAILRLGFIANFLAKQVISGYMHGLALIISVGQLPDALGIHVSSSTVIPQVIEISKNLKNVNWVAVSIAVFCIPVILCFRQWLPPIPGEIVAIIAAVVLVRVFELERLGLSVVGNIPSGVPHFSPPGVNTADVWALLPVSFAGAVLAFSDTMVQRSDSTRCGGLLGHIVRRSRRL